MIDLTIIIPTKNASGVLSNVLKSIFDQGTKHTYEVIVVDGMSTDNTIEIAKQFSTFVIKQESTIYEAQNIGIGASSGKYLYFIGADDTLVPGAIDAMLTSEVNLTQGLVYHSHVTFVYSNFQQSFVYDRNLFRDYGLFDTNHIVYADLDFKRRLADNVVFPNKIAKPFAKIAPFGFSSTWRKQ